MKSLEDQLRSYGDHLDTVVVSPARSRSVVQWRIIVAAVIGLVLVVVGIAALRREEPPAQLAAGGTPVALVLPGPPKGAVATAAVTRRYEAGVLSGRAVYGNGDVTAQISFSPGGGTVLGDRWTDIDLDGRPARFSSSFAPGGTIEIGEKDEDQLYVYGGRGMDIEVLRRIAAGVRVAPDHTITVEPLPAGWRELWDDAAATGTFEVRDYHVDFGQGRFILVTSWYPPPDGGVYGIGQRLDPELVEVRDSQARLDDIGDDANPFLWWKDTKTGIIVLVQYSGGTRQEILEVAEQLVYTDDRGWQQIETRRVADEIATTSTSTSTTVEP